MPAQKLPLARRFCYVSWALSPKAHLRIQPDALWKTKTNHVPVVSLFVFLFSK